MKSWSLIILWMNEFYPFPALSLCLDQCAGPFCNWTIKVRIKSVAHNENSNSGCTEQMRLSSRNTSASTFQAEKKGSWDLLDVHAGEEQRLETSPRIHPPPPSLYECTDVTKLCCRRLMQFPFGAPVQPKVHKRRWEIHKVCGLITHRATFCASMSSLSSVCPSACLSLLHRLPVSLFLGSARHLLPNHTYLSGITALGTVGYFLLTH